MRTGPFAQDNVIRMLNNCYVSLYVAEEDFDSNGKLPADEKAEIRRIVNEAHEAKMRVGSVCIYIAGPDGKILDGLKVPQLYDPPQNTIDLLQRTIDKLKVKEGKPLVKPTAQSVPPKADADALVLHVAVREDNQKHSWQSYPAEDWLTFPKAEWSKFLPSGGARSYEVDPAVAKKLLTHFYPGTEDTHSDQVDRNVIETATIQAKVLSPSRIQLEGTLKMTRPFYPNHPEHKPVPVVATVLGFVEVDGGKIRSFKVATEKATFGGKGFGAAAWTVKEKANENVRPAADSRDSR
jgi:hypothetical protein